MSSFLNGITSTSYLLVYTAGLLSIRQLVSCSKNPSLQSHKDTLISQQSQEVKSALLSWIHLLHKLDTPAPSHKCMADIADLFFSFGGINYARYLTWFNVFLTNIDDTHPGARQLLEKGAISVVRSKRSVTRQDHGGNLHEVCKVPCWCWWSWSYWYL